MLSHRYDDALAYAAEVHRRQVRKGSDIPYISHLLAVSALVIEHGGDEDQAISGLLHDVVEDHGAHRADEIARRFGDRVARIVLECSDSQDDDKAPWRERKVAYLASIATKSDDAILVTTCDKLHNATAILNDLATVGPALWDRFTGRRDGTLWYYRGLAEALAPRAPGPLFARLERTIREIEAAAGRSD